MDVASKLGQAEKVITSQAYKIHELTGQRDHARKQLKDAEGVDGFRIVAIDLSTPQGRAAADLHNERDTLKTEVERLNGALNGYKVDFNRERRKVLDLNARIGELEGKLHLAEQDLEKDAHNRADKMREDALKRQNDELIEEKRELEADRDRLERHNTEQREQLGRVINERDKTQTDLDAYKTRAATQTVDLTHLRAERDTLQERLNYWIHKHGTPEEIATLIQL